MNRFLRRMRRIYCRHDGKRVWDLNRLPDGTFRARLYCPDCGWRRDEVRGPDEIVRDAASDNPEMRDTMRRNLRLDHEDPEND